MRSKYFLIFTPLIVIAAGAAILMWPILSGKILFSQKFIGLYHYIYFGAMKHFLLHLGMLPNWWPAYNSGYPINLTLDAFLNPFFLVTLKFLPAFFANNLMVFIFFILNGLSLYALARALKLSRAGSLITAVSYAFSGIVLRWISVTTFAAVLPILPLSFLCCLKILNGKTKWFWLWFPLITYSWIGGFAELTVYSLIAVSFFAAYLIYKKWKKGNFKYQYPVLFFGAIVLSIIILSPWFLSILNFISFSSRAGGMEADSANSMPTTFSHLIHLFNPRISVFYGDLLPIIQFNSMDYALYMGTISLIFLFTSFFTKYKKEKNYLIFFLALAGAGILMTVKHSPLYWLSHQIPVLKWFRFYWKWSFVVIFSWAILAGYGFDNVKDFFKNRFSKKIIISMWLILALVLLISTSLAVFDKTIKTKISSYGINNYTNTENRTFSQNDDYYKRIIEKMSDSLVNTFSLKDGWIIIMFLLWIFSLVVITAGKFDLMNQQRWRMTAVFVALLGSIAPWLGFLNGPPVSYLKEMPETAKYMHSVNAYSSEKLPLEKEMAQTLTPYRIFIYTPDRYVSEISNQYGIFFTEEEYKNPVQKELMNNNVHKAFGFDTFYNHQTLSSKRLVALYYLSKAQEVFTEESYKDTTPLALYLENFSSGQNFNRLGMANIKYILTPLELPGELKPVFETFVTEKEIPVYIYENTHFMPRWYFANEIKWTEPQDEIALNDLQLIEDFKQTTLLEKININDGAIIAKPDKSDSFEIELYTAGQLKVRTKTKNYRFLVFSESRFPDFWQATINEKETSIYTANYLYQAVLIPPGENIIEFNYPNLLNQGLISFQKYIDAATDKIIKGGTAGK